MGVASHVAGGRRSEPRGAVGQDAASAYPSSGDAGGRRVSNELTRYRLLERLDERWRRDVVVIEAAAGYGKSVLISQMVEGVVYAPGGIDVVVECQTGDADAEFFANRILAALGTEGQSRGEPADHAEIVGASIASRAPVDVCLVLDDLHRLPEESTGYEFLRALLRALPRNGHLVLSGRIMPHLPLARLMATDQCVQLSTDDLTFSAEELALFGKDRDANADDAGGWPAMVQLAAASEAPTGTAGLWETVIGALEPEVCRATAYLVMVEEAGVDEIEASVGVGLDAVRAVAALPLVRHNPDGTLQPHELWDEWLDLLMAEFEPSECYGLIERAAATMARRNRVDAALELAVTGGCLDRMARLVCTRIVTQAQVAVGDAQAQRWLDHLDDAEEDSPSIRLLAAMALRFKEGAEAGLDAVQEALVDFMDADDRDGEALARAELIYRLFRTGDQATLLEHYERAKELAADPTIRYLDAFIGTVDAMIADLSGDPESALATLEALDLTAMSAAQATVIVRWCASLLALVGRSEDAVAAIGRIQTNAFEVPSTPERTLRAITLWQHGDPTEVLGLLGRGELQGGQNARDRFISAIYDSIVSASLGVRVATTSEELRAIGAGHARDDAYAALAAAASLVAEGRETEAAAEIGHVLDAWGADHKLALSELRRFIGLSSVLSDELRGRFAGEVLGPRHAARLAAAQALVDLRAGASDVTLTTDPADTFCALPLRWTTELALRSIDHDPEGAAALGAFVQDTVPDAYARVLPEVVEDHGLDRQAGELAEMIGAPPTGKTVVVTDGGMQIGAAGNDPVPVGRQRERELLALLVLRRQVTRDGVVDALWGDRPRDSALNNLRVTLTHLRRDLDPQRPASAKSFHLRTDGDTVALHLSPSLHVDWWRLEDALAAAATAESRADLGRAHELYEVVRHVQPAAFFSELDAIDVLDHDVSEARRRLRTAITRLAEIDLVHGSPDAALATAQRIVADTPDDERARRVIIRAHLDTGELDEAKREYDRLTASLGETGRTPSDETMMVVRSVGLDR